MKNIAIILASGSGERFGSTTPKQFLKLAGKTVLEHTLDCFESHQAIDEIVVVCAESSKLLVEELVNKPGYVKVRKIVLGGKTRQASSGSGIAAVVGDEHKVLVHDAVRPLIDHATIDRCLAALDQFSAVDTGILSGDTVVQIGKDNLIHSIPDRTTLRLGQTPQGFISGVLREAHRRAKSDPQLSVTDDCGLVLYYELCPIKLVEGSVSNIKITYPSDIYLADRLFQLRTRSIHRTSPERQLVGKTIVVFGGSRGIGRSIVERAEKLGAHVYSASRSSGVNIVNAHQVSAFLKMVESDHGRVDYVVNTAGVLRTGLLDGQNEKDIDDQIDINLRGSIVVARESYRSMKGAGGGILLFASSSFTRGRARSAVYSATKAAVVNLMQGLAEEFKPGGVQINVISPERTATPMRTENFGKEPAHQLLDAETVAEISLKVLTSSSTGEVIDVSR